MEGAAPEGDRRHERLRRRSIIREPRLSGSLRTKEYVVFIATNYSAHETYHAGVKPA